MGLSRFNLNRCDVRPHLASRYATPACAFTHPCSFTHTHHELSLFHTHTFTHSHSSTHTQSKGQRGTKRKAERQQDLGDGLVANRRSDDLPDLRSSSTTNKTVDITARKRHTADIVTYEKHDTRATISGFVYVSLSVSSVSLSVSVCLCLSLSPRTPCALTLKVRYVVASARAMAVASKSHAGPAG